jgi:hypothetical protein
LAERAHDLLGLLRAGGFGDRLADALGPAAERAADRSQGVGGIVAVVAAVGHEGPCGRVAEVGARMRCQDARAGSRGRIAGLVGGPGGRLVGEFGELAAHLFEALLERTELDEGVAARVRDGWLFGQVTAGVLAAAAPGSPAGSAAVDCTAAARSSRA